MIAVKLFADGATDCAFSGMVASICKCVRAAQSNQPRLGRRPHESNQWVHGDGEASAGDDEIGGKALSLINRLLTDPPKNGFAVANFDAHPLGARSEMKDATFSPSCLCR